MRMSHCFQRTLMLSSAEMVFSSSIVVTLLRHCVLLSSDLALFASLLLDLDSYGVNDPDGIYSLLYMQVAQELAPKLAVMFRHLVKGDSLPACWRLAHVITVPKESHFSDVGN